MTTTDLVLPSDDTWTTISTTTTAIIQNTMGVPLRYRFGTSTSVGHKLEPIGSVVISENIQVKPEHISGGAYSIVVTK